MLMIAKITDVQAEQYLQNVKMLRSIGVRDTIAAPYIVMVKGYADDWNNYTELTEEDLENDNVVDAGYEDYEFWLNDTLSNLVDNGIL